MASLNFYLEKRRDKDGRIKTERVPILLYFSYDGKRFQFNTGENTDFDKWDFENQKVLKNVSGNEQINGYLNLLGEEVFRLYREAKIQGIQPGPYYFRRHLKGRPKRSGFGFFEVYMKFIENNSERWSIHTFRKVKTNYNHMRAFEVKSGYTIDFSRINEDFYSKYLDYFKSLGHTNPTIYKNLMVLKWFLNWSLKNGYNRNTFFRDYAFPWDYHFKANANDYYLEWSELMKLLNVEIGQANIRLARDIFCFLCFTGLKFSVLKYLRRESFTDQAIRLSLPGKSDMMYIPLNKFSAEIIGKYLQTANNGQIFPDLNIITMNRLIKEAGKIAELNESFQIKICSENEKIAREIPKYKMLSTKVARNTFIFHALRLGISLQLIMKFTGLKTIHGIEKFRNESSALSVSEMSRFNEYL